MSSTMASVTMAAVNTVSTTGGSSSGCTGVGNLVEDFTGWTFGGDDSFVYSGDQPLTAAASGGAVSLTGTNNNYMGFGYVLDSCIDATGCTGVSFDIGGSAGGGEAVFQLRSAANLGTSAGGTCTASDCSNNQSSLSLSGSVQTVRVPFSSLAGGSPQSSTDGDGVCGFQWQFHCTDGAACAVDVTLDEIRFY
jgi:hypothetical protein